VDVDKAQDQEKCGVDHPAVEQSCKAGREERDLSNWNSSLPKRVPRPREETLKITSFIIDNRRSKPRL